MSVRGPTRQQKEFVDIYLKNRKKNQKKVAVDDGFRTQKMEMLSSIR